MVIGAALDEMETEKGKLFEKKGRKAEDLRQVVACYDGRATWNTILYFRGERRMLFTESEMKVIDVEWFTLILEAKELGLSIEAIRKFLNQNEEKELITKNS
jgi:predicted RNA-binding protein YlqC (UPF0109 family)